jgi:hydroxymethylglutaryl-CoA lyase
MYLISGLSFWVYKVKMINSNNHIEFIECPRDAMQGWKNFIPTPQKIEYLNALLQVGFSVLDCGSFVSAKAIPQMADTAEVLRAIDIKNSKTKLLVIVANYRGAEEAIKFEQVDYLGFPLSLSPTFQMRNTNATIEEAVERVASIQNLCVQRHKKLVVYISMGFGNPYGDSYTPALLTQYADVLASMGISIISLADTVGVATPVQIEQALDVLIPAYPALTIGVHLHARTTDWEQKIQAAISKGCRRFDGAIKGIGGCPMAQDDLVGNMDSLVMLPYFKQAGMNVLMDETALFNATQIANSIFI